jgi:hypothetical protein
MILCTAAATCSSDTLGTAAAAKVAAAAATCPMAPQLSPYSCPSRLTQNMAQQALVTPALGQMAPVTLFLRSALGQALPITLLVLSALDRVMLVTLLAHSALDLISPVTLPAPSAQGRVSAAVALQVPTTCCVDPLPGQQAQQQVTMAGVLWAHMLNSIHTCGRSSHPTLCQTLGQMSIRATGWCTSWIVLLLATGRWWCSTWQCKCLIASKCCKPLTLVCSMHDGSRGNGGGVAGRVGGGEGGGVGGQWYQDVDEAAGGAPTCSAQT